MRLNSKRLLVVMVVYRHASIRSRTVELDLWGSDVIAGQNGACPLCSTYISKNKSKIVRLPEPVAPRATPDGRYSLDTGQAYNSTGKLIKLQPRQWCHERCLDTLDRKPAYLAVEEAGRWRAVRKD